MNPLIFEPSQIDFGKVPDTQRPTSLDLHVKNQGGSLLELHFEQAKTSWIWFTETNKLIQEQRKSQLNLFFKVNKLKKVTIPPHQEIQISCVIVPSKVNVDMPFKCWIPTAAYNYNYGSEFDDYGSESDGEIIECDEDPIFSTLSSLVVNVQVEKVKFTIEPEVIFLKDCNKDESQIADFQLINKSSFLIPIMIYTNKEIEMITPTRANYIELAPLSSMPLSLKYSPTQIGQFCNRIEFYPLIGNTKSVLLTTISSVSPFVSRDIFPIITPSDETLHFGSIHANQQVSADFMITNPSDYDYNIIIDGITDIFKDAASMSVHLEPTPTTNLLFRTTLSPKSLPQLSMNITSHSTITVTVLYTPSPSDSPDYSTFEERIFMLSLKFNNHQTKTAFYKHIECRARVCHSKVTLTPESINFGDTTVGKNIKTSTITLTNNSPLPTTLTAKGTSKSLVVSPAPIEIPAHSSVPFTFSFYPYKVNSDYKAQVKFTYSNNKSADIHLDIAGVIVSAPSESLHSSMYSISCDNHHVSTIQMGNSIINFPSVKSFVIRNRTDSPLKLIFNSSSPDELHLYEELGQPIKSSQTFDSSSSLTNQSFSLDQSSYDLLSDKVTTMSQLESACRLNSLFFQNVFSMTSHFPDPAIVDHFSSLTSLIDSFISNGVISSIEGQQIFIPSQSKLSIYIILTPKSDKTQRPGLWQHREESITVSFAHIEEVESLNIPVIFNACESVTFLSSTNLNFGVIQANTKLQHKIYMINESSVPLLFHIESHPPVVFDKRVKGIVFPLSSYPIPFTLDAQLDGPINERILIHNVLNPSKPLVINLKGTIVRRSNFYVDPMTIDFGTVTAGSSSQRVLLFLANTSSDENEFTLSHSQKDCLISIKFVKSSNVMTEKRRLQIEKLGNKLRCLERKHKKAYAAKIQRMIDDLSRTTLQSTSSQLRLLNAKYMDRLTFKAGGLQLNCLELQLIPTNKTSQSIEGVIMIYERGLFTSQKVIHYKARVVPVSLMDSLERAIEVNPSSIEISMFVHECKSFVIRIKNISNTPLNYWISSDSNQDAIITSTMAEETLKDFADVPIDVFALQPGNFMKTITVTAQSTSIKVPISITACYREVIGQLPKSIDFGMIPLTSLQIIEKRDSFLVLNQSEQVLHVGILNLLPAHLVMYEHDPKEPLSTAIKLDPAEQTIVNLLLKPQMDRQEYRNCKALAINGKLALKAFETEEEAVAFLTSKDQSMPCVFSQEIPVDAIVGRVGLGVDSTKIDFGSVAKGSTSTMKINVKNRSSHIPLEVSVMASQGVVVEPASFVGNKMLTVSFASNSVGLNEGSVTLNALNVSYSKELKISSFVDPGVLLVNEKVDLGKLYSQSTTMINIPVKNISKYECAFRVNSSMYRVAPNQTVDVSMEFPPADFDCENGEFEYKLLFFNAKTNHEVLKAVDILGEFVVSNAMIDQETVSLGRFGEINHWQCPQKTIKLINCAKIPAAFMVEQSPHCLRLPAEIGPFDDECEVPIVPDVDVLRHKKQGKWSTKVALRNANNPQNVLALRVDFALAKSFVEFDRDTIEVEKFTEISGTKNYRANEWLKVTNCTEDECQVKIDVEELVEGVHVEVFQGSSEVSVKSLYLQVNETGELRVKVTVGQQLEKSKPLVLAHVFFSSTGDPIVMNVMYHPNK